MPKLKEHSIRQAKGSTLRATLDFLRRDLGEERLLRILSGLPEAEQRAALAAAPADEIPFRLLLAVWRAADAELRSDRPDWIERSGAFSIESGGVQHYGGILKKASPVEFLTQRISLFRLFYQPGDMQAVEVASGRAVLRLIGFEDDGDPLFCRRQTGGLQRALEIAGGEAASVRHVRCVWEGDGFCEWELRWR
jgi:hypothetical protein